MLQSVSTSVIAVWTTRFTASSFLILQNDNRVFYYKQGEFYEYFKEE
jgi:hypothetical protein